jgi:hypothetical protein
MANIHSDSEYGEIGDHANPEPVLKAHRPKDLKWVGFALIATVCFAASGYILGFLSAAGVAAKFLNSIGYLTVSIGILLSKQILHIY